MDELLDMQEKRDYCDYEDCVWVENLGISFQAMRHDENLTDMKLCAGDCEFPCHRMMLAASSPFFQAMFIGPLKEQSREKVDLQDTRPSIAELLLDYMYTGRLKITQENVEELLITANFLLLGRLVDACSDFLHRQLDFQNCLGMYTFAEAHGCGELRRAAHRFILKNFVQVSASSAFLEATFSQLSSVLVQDKLCVPTERHVYCSIIVWASHDLPARKSCVHDLLKLVRLPYMSKKSLSELSSEPLLSSCSKCQDVLQMAKDCKSDVILPYPSEWSSPRRSTNQVQALVVLGGVQSCQRGNSSSSLQHHSCDPSTMPLRWSKQSAMPYMLRNTVMYDVAQFHNAIYVSGGFDGELGTLSHVWRYQIEEDGSQMWTRAPSLNAARYQHGSAVVQGKLYVVGGFNGERTLGEVECYTPDWDQWKSCPPMPEPVTFPAAAGCRERLYVIGGMKADASAFPWMQCLNVSSQSWSVIKTLQLTTKGSKSVVLNDVIYVVGGPSRDVHVYDPDSDTAFDVAPTKDFHVCAGVAVNRGHIYIAGGDNLQDRRDWDTIESYDPATNTWTTVGQLPGPLYWHGLVSVVRSIDQPLPPDIPDLYPLGPSMLFRGYEERRVDYDPR